MAMDRHSRPLGRRSFRIKWLTRIMINPAQVKRTRQILKGWLLLSAILVAVEAEGHKIEKIMPAATAVCPDVAFMLWLSRKCNARPGRGQTCRKISLFAR